MRVVTPRKSDRPSRTLPPPVIIINSPLLPATPLTGYNAIVTQAPLPYYAPINLDVGEMQSIEADLDEPVTLNYDQVSSVVVGGQAIAPARDPQNPQSGEYVWNPYTRQLRVYGVSGRSVLIGGSVDDIPIFPSPIPPPYPDLFTKLPLTGDFQLNRNFGQMPGASFEFEVALPKSVLEGIFAPGLEIDLYGLPLRINNLDIDELPRSIYPDARCKVSISCGGRWENRLEDAVFLRKATFSTAPNDQPFQDPDCATGVDNKQQSEKQVEVPVLMARAGMNYLGPSLKPVDIPPDTPLEATVDLGGILQERSLVAGGFLFWSNPAGVEVRRVGSQRVWNYSESQIMGEVSTTYEAIDKQRKRQLLTLADYNPPPPDLINFPSTVQALPIPALRAESPKSLGFQYPNTEITFNDTKDVGLSPQERTQGSKPRYVRQDEKIETEVRGDKNAHQVPAGIRYLQSMSLCFDIGGPTRNRTYVTTRNGADWRITSETWGFAFIAGDIYSEGLKKIRGNPNIYWTKLESTTAEYIYHEGLSIGTGTGYLLRIIESGYRTVRWRQESSGNPETLPLRLLLSDSADTGLKKQQRRSLYEFFRIPVIKETSYALRLLPEYSTDEAYELYKRCNRDGTSSLEIIYNPNFAPPYYIAREVTESSSYARRSNPDNPKTITASNPALPDLEVGEETRFEAITSITEAEYKKTLVVRNGKVGYLRGEQISPQKWVRWSTKYSTGGQSIGQSLTDTNEETGTGDPPLGTRRPPVYTREEDVQSEPKPEVPDENTYRYYVQTAGYTVSDPVQGSESFPLASNLEEALLAARTKLAIENWRNGYRETLQIAANVDMAEGDRFNYLCNGEYRQRVVLSANTTGKILGVVDGVRKVVGVTSLTLGPWVQPQMTNSKVLQPKEPKPPKTNVTVLLSPTNDQLGDGIPWLDIVSRRNPG